MNCKHTKVWGLTWAEHGWMVGGEDARQCMDCGAFMPIGPSDETPVAVEVRAAEIAATGRLGARCEACGWELNRQDQRDTVSVPTGQHVNNKDFEAGWLARCIVDHPTKDGGGRG